jgi:hypothetical protein
MIDDLKCQGVPSVPNTTGLQVTVGIRVYTGQYLRRIK